MSRDTANPVIYKQAHPSCIVLLRAEVIVLVTNTFVDMIQKPLTRNTGEAADFIAKFGTVFLFITRAARLGCKPLAAFFCVQI